VGIALLLLSLASRLINATHPFGIVIIVSSLAFAAFNGGFMWVVYLAIEPYARQVWPDALLAWARVTAGRLRDPRVGRELLIGLVFGAFSLILVEAPKPLAASFGLRMPVFPFGNSLWVLDGAPSLVTFWLRVVIDSIESTLEIALILLVPRFILKRSRISIVVGIALLLSNMNGGSVISGSWLDVYNDVAFTLLLVFVIYRAGLLAAAVTLLVDNIVSGLPLAMHTSAWWFTPTLLTMTLLGGLAAFAYVAARGGKPLVPELA